MADVIYTTSPEKLKPLFDKLKSVGVPTKATLKWLGSVGFKTYNDRSLLRVLKGLGFCDDSGVPSPRWTAYRAAPGAELAKAVHAAYADLFHTYADANSRDDATIRTWLVAQTKSGEQVIRFALATFKKLCALSDFSVPSPNESPRDSRDDDDVDLAMSTSGAAAPAQGASSTIGRSIVLNVNIQLSLPETKDEAVYDALFRSLRTHLLDRSE